LFNAAKKARKMTNLKPVDVSMVGGGWSGLAMA
jgi:hypothetical protein